jgi:hypothetical protein
MRLAPALFIATLACAPAAAQTALVEMPRVGERSLAFIDVGGIRQSGTDVEVQLLSATATPEGQEAPVDGTLLSYRVACGAGRAGGQGGGMDRGRRTGRRDVLAMATLRDALV